MGRQATLFDDLVSTIAGYGVRVMLKEMDVETPGEFDGLTITINPKHDRESASYYLAHSFGSIVQWSTDFPRARQVFDELRDAKQARRQDPVRFERALEPYSLFEQTSSEHAVWLLGQVGHEEAIDPYTVFFRADLEAMLIFHRTGKAPRWPEFFAEWKRKVASSEIRIEPFRPKPISPFTPIKIEQQQVLQEHD